MHRKVRATAAGLLLLAQVVSAATRQSTAGRPGDFPAALAESIEQLSRSLDGIVELYIRHLESEATFGLHADEPFPMASTVKVRILRLVLGIQGIYYAATALWAIVAFRTSTSPVATTRGPWHAGRRRRDRQRAPRHLWLVADDPREPADRSPARSLELFTLARHPPPALRPFARRQPRGLELALEPVVAGLPPQPDEAGVTALREFLETHPEWRDSNVRPARRLRSFITSRSAVPFSSDRLTRRRGIGAPSGRR